MKIDPVGETPKEELFAVFKKYGHIPWQRNSRHGYIIVQCKAVGCCTASCSCSANQRDGWYVLTCTEEVLRKCGGQLCEGMVVYGGVRWCTSVMCMQM
jgi:hypothetical protein